MDELQRTEPMSLRDTAKGVAVRAGILSVAGLVVGAWVFGLAAKTASALVKVVVGLLLLTIGAGVATWEVKKVQRRFAGGNGQSEL
jgi:ascorbate-specific PTS system EIIC-type component UlaA